jgi:hypothetical protein
MATMFRLGVRNPSKEPDEILSEPSREQLLSVLRVLFERLNIKNMLWPIPSILWRNMPSGTSTN